jgi:hypothetical protein
MTDRQDIELLRKEIAELKAMLDDLIKAVAIDRKETAEHIIEFYRQRTEFYREHIEAAHDITKLYNMVVPLEAEIFPNVSKARQQFFDAIEKAKPVSGKGQQDDKP